MPSRLPLILAAVIVLAFPLAVGATTPASSWAELCGPAITAASAGNGSILSGVTDFLTGDGHYMPRTHCMVNAEGKTDWPWVWALVILNIIVITGYLRIFLFWRTAYLSELPEDRNKKLMDLAWIFLWCAVCGYVASVVVFVWPAYRGVALCLVPLALFTWKFAAKLDDFKVSLSAKRLERELRESLEARNAQLERMVEERTLELKLARDEADHANQAKSRFLAHMSHEIRTPMNAILGYIDLTRSPDCSAEQRENNLSTIDRNGRHLLRLINDVLDLSKVEAGALEIEQVSVDPVRLLNDTVNLFKANASEQKLAFDLRFETDLPSTIVCDPTRLQQSLSNLLGNAIKFTETGGVTITARYNDPANTLEVDVADTGIGIPEQSLANLFQAFQQADASTTRKYGGTGLGLKIARELARRMGGDITVQSEVGIGTTFTLAIDCGERGPLMPAEDRPERVVIEEAPANGDSRLPAKILIVDDAPDNRRLFSHILTRAGATVDTANDGWESLQKFTVEQAEFDIVLMDIEMPVMNGIDTTRAMRKLGLDLPIIACSANCMLGDRERYLEAGCDDYAPKPINARDLISLCRQYINASVAA